MTANTALALTEENDEDLARWNSYLKSIAAGVSPADSMQLHGLLWREVEAFALSGPTEAQKWRDARLLGKASRWSLTERDEVFDRIGSGVEIERAITEVRGGENLERDVADLFELVAALPDWQDRYDAAMRARGFRDVRELRAIADDTSRDTLETAKGPQANMAAVGRDKLRVETRQWLLSKLDPARWGDQKASTNVQVNVHYAEILEAAQARAKLRGKGAPKITQQVLDAAFTSTPAESQPAAEQQSVESAEAANPFAAAWED